ncbi:hypothetical protein NC651_018846 [Populus alba x Populus x berolinensis]|nr:hypothetical protein NC651_018846 [Populus alba x Populus x berolinensis]
MYIEPPFPSLSYKRTPPPSVLSHFQITPKKMVVESLTEEVWLSFAIFLFLCLYLFLVVLESSWSNSAASWLPQDCFLISNSTQKKYGISE